MALPVLINRYFKFFSAMSPIALHENTPACCIRGVLKLLFMSTIRTYYFLFYFFNVNHLPAMEINAFFRAFRISSIFSGSILFAFRVLHSFLICFCSLVKCFNTSLFSSARIETIRPRGVSGEIPTSKSRNSSHDILFISRESRNPYCA